MPHLAHLLTDPASPGSNRADAFDVVIPSLPGSPVCDRMRGYGPRVVRVDRGLGFDPAGESAADIGLDGRSGTA
jgi:hypothetical protein